MRIRDSLKDDRANREGGSAEKSVQRTGAAAIVTLGPLTVTTSPSGRTALARVARHESPPFQSTGVSFWTASAKATWKWAGTIWRTAKVKGT